MFHLLAVSKLWIQQQKRLPGPSAVIRMADEPDLLADIYDEDNVRDRLDLIFHDSAHAAPGVRPPRAEHARAILQFVKAAEGKCEYLIVQCEAGIGRSRAVAAAIGTLGGTPEHENPFWLTHTYNRRLYGLILEAAGHPLPADPLASVIVRVKYSLDHLADFYSCMKRQRYENWELVIVTDGPHPDARGFVEVARDDIRMTNGGLKPAPHSSLRLVETSERRGRWGHPWRQSGIDAARGELIALSNDDNYYVPGWLEQMAAALRGKAGPDERFEFDLARCPFLHSYNAWRVTEAGADLGAWLCRADLIKKHPWTGVEFNSDRTYFQALCAIPGIRIATIDHPLFVHN